MAKKLRQSRLNPYHTELNEVEAANMTEAKAIGRKQNKGEVLYKGIRVSTEQHCSVQEEFEKFGNVIRNNHDVTHLIPRDKNGKLDLLAEEPIVVMIVPVEGPSLVGHAAMQYKDNVLNRRSSKMDNAPLFSAYSTSGEYYFIYPGKLGINVDELKKTMDEVKVRSSKKYNLFSNNCAGAVYSVFNRLGVKINLLGPDDLGLTIATPGNNPYGFGIKHWCEENGVHVHAEEMQKLYKYNGKQTDTPINFPHKKGLEK